MHHSHMHDHDHEHAEAEKSYYAGPRPTLEEALTRNNIPTQNMRSLRVVEWYEAQRLGGRFGRYLWLFGVDRAYAWMHTKTRLLNVRLSKNMVTPRSDDVLLLTGVFIGAAGFITLLPLWNHIFATQPWFMWWWIVGYVLFAGGAGLCLAGLFNMLPAIRSPEWHRVYPEHERAKILFAQLPPNDQVMLRVIRRAGYEWFINEQSKGNSPTRFVCVKPHAQRAIFCIGELQNERDSAIRIVPLQQK